MRYTQSLSIYSAYPLSAASSVILSSVLSIYLHVSISHYLFQLPSDIRPTLKTQAVTNSPLKRDPRRERQQEIDTLIKQQPGSPSILLSIYLSPSTDYSINVMPLLYCWCIDVDLFFILLGPQYQATFSKQYQTFLDGKGGSASSLIDQWMKIKRKRDELDSELRTNLPFMIDFLTGEKMYLEFR